MIATKERSYKEGKKTIKYKIKIGEADLTEIQQSCVEAKVTDSFMTSLYPDKVYLFLAYPVSLPTPEVRKVFDEAGMSQSKYKKFGEMFSNGIHYRLIADMHGVKNG